MSSSSTQFGLPLTQASKQTILPVVEISGSTAIVHGFFPIASTTFPTTNTPTTFAIQSGPGGTVNIQSVTPPTGAVERNAQTNPTQYMAVVYTYAQSKLQPWLGYTSFIDRNNTGYYSDWATGLNRFGEGNLIGSLRVNMSRYPTATIVDPTPPDAGDASLNWFTDIDTTGQPECSFFDFNWVTTFNAQMLPGVIPGSVQPLRLDIVTNPDGGYFKAAQIQTDPVYLPGGAPMFNTIRVVKLVDVVPAGDYFFTFNVVSNQNGVEITTPVTLTLTVITGIVSIPTAPAIGNAVPTITGTPTVGTPLTATHGNWTGSPQPTYTYQWQQGTTDIAGATTSTYTPVIGDVGKTLRVVVTATNATGNSTADSVNTANVIAAA